MSEATAALFHGYLEHLRTRGLSPASILHARDALGHFRRFLRDRGAPDLHAALLAVRTEDLARFAAALAAHRGGNGREWSEGTQEIYYRAVVRFCRYLARTGKVLADATLALPPRRHARRLPRAVPTQDEVRALLAAPDVRRPLGLRDRAILELFYSTGLRRGEVSRLSLYDVDLRARLVRVRMGKGKKDRLVPMGRVAARWLAEYVRRVRPTLARDARETALFLGCAGRALGHEGLSGRVRRYVRRARLEKNVTCHSLRHAFATHLLQEGASIRPIQAMLGHASVDTTQMYTHLVPADLARAIERYHPLERSAGGRGKRKKSSVPPGTEV